MPGREERRPLAGKASAKGKARGSSASTAAAAAESSSKGDGSGAASSFDFYGAAASAAANPKKFIAGMATWLETSDATEPGRWAGWFCEDFKPRRLKAPLVLAWLVFQAMGLVYQLSLYSEISQNLDSFEATLEENCGPQHRQHGVCLGPSWSMSYTGMLTFPAVQRSDDSQADFDFVIPSDQTFNFEISSHPATFLIGVEPQAPHATASWKVNVAPGGSSGNGNFNKPGWDPDIRPMRGSGSQYRVCTSKSSRGSSWTGSMSLKSELPDQAQVQVYVVDSRIQHLDDVHKQPQCSFETSWQNFSERASGDHHFVLTLARYATGFFLLVSLGCSGLVLHRFYHFVESGKLLSRIIALKFLVQDLPQQICIVAYIYAWYANNGLRCQMCLFHPSHCDDQHPLHWTNLCVCFFTLLSASANQMLLQAKSRRYDEEEECFLWFTRGVMLSVSILPFSTGIIFLGWPVLHLRSVLVYILAGVPTLIGWGAVLCVPTVALCDDEWDEEFGH